MVYVHESAPRRRIVDESEILELSTSPNHGAREATDREIASLLATLSGRGTTEL
jgi:hypothetical protein